MGRLDERLSIAAKALRTFGDLLSTGTRDAVVRDAAIQRFEYSFEALWKAAQLYLSAIEGVEQASPKGVVRSCFQAGLLSADQAESALVMTDDRNLTVHTYNEELAEAIFSRLPGHASLMVAWLEAMRKRASARL